jgi:hypothetical protein
MKWRTAIGARFARDEAAGCPGSTLEYARQRKPILRKAKFGGDQGRQSIEQRHGQGPPPDDERTRDRVRPG